MNAPAMNTPNPEQVTSRPNLSQARQLVVCEAGGDPAKITGPADAQVESGRQTVPSETRSEPRSGQNGEYIATQTDNSTCTDVRSTGWEPDPFGQIFAGKRMAKLPNRPLNRLGVQLLEKAEALGVTLDDDATVYWGAACITLMQAGFQPRTSFFVAICQRLSQCAEGADDLGEFLAALHPGLLCEKTAVGYTVERDGKLISWRGSVAAQYYVEIFVLVSNLATMDLLWRTAANTRTRDVRRRGFVGRPRPRREARKGRAPLGPRIICCSTAHRQRLWLRRRERKRDHGAKHFWTA